MCLERVLRLTDTDVTVGAVLAREQSRLRTVAKELTPYYPFHTGPGQAQAERRCDGDHDDGVVI